MNLFYLYIYWLDTLCFNQPTVSVVEKERVELVLTVSKKLSRSVRVNLIYSNGTGYPATYFPRPPGELCVVIMLFTRGLLLFKFVYEISKSALNCCDFLSSHLISGNKTEFRENY